MDQTVVSGLVTAAVLAFAVWRQMRGRTLRADRLWLMPVVITGISAIEIYPHAVFPKAFAFVIALALGAGFGVLRARLMRVEPLPATGEIRVKGSPVGMLLWVSLFALKKVLLPTPTAGHGADDAALWFALCTALSFAVGTVCARQATLYCLYRKAVAASPELPIAG